MMNINKDCNYTSEVILLTKSDHEDEFRCWLDWHLNVIKFDHAVVFDNESNVGIKSVCNEYGDRVDYHFVSGWPDMNKLRNEQIKSSLAKWVIPLDDDEFLYVGDKYNHNVNEFLNSMYSVYHRNKVYIAWVNLMSKDEIQFKSDLYINTHTYYSNKALLNIYRYWRADNGWGKCFSNTEFPHYYSSHNRYSSGHIPRYTSGDNTAIYANGNKVLHEWQPGGIEVNTDCFIAHYQFKTLNDWKIKCSRPLVDNQITKPAPYVHVYEKLYRYKSLFEPFTLIKDTWNNYIRNKESNNEVD